MGSMSGTNNSERNVLSFISKLFKPWSSDQNDLSADVSKEDYKIKDQNQHRSKGTKENVVGNNSPKTPEIDSENGIGNIIQAIPSREDKRVEINDSFETKTSDVKDTRLKRLQINETSTPKRMGKLKLTGFDRLLKELSSPKINQDNKIESKYNKNESNLSKSSKSIKLRGFVQLKEELSTTNKNQVNLSGFKHSKESISQKAPPAIKLRGFDQLKEELNSPRKIVINQETNFLSSLRSALSGESLGLREISLSESKTSTNNLYNNNSLDESLTIIDTHILEDLIQDKPNDLNEKTEMLSYRENDVIQIEVVEDTIKSGVQSQNNHQRHEIQNVNPINEEIEVLGEEIAREITKERSIIMAESVLESGNYAQNDYESQKVHEIHNINSNNNAVENMIQEESNKRDAVIISEKTDNNQVENQSQHNESQEIQEIQISNSFNENLVIIRRKEVNKSDEGRLNEKADNFQGGGQNKQIHAIDNINSYSEEVSTQEKVNDKSKVRASEKIENVPGSDAQVDQQSQQSQQMQEPYTFKSYNNEVENIRKKEANKRDVPLGERTENVQYHSESQKAVNSYNNGIEISRREDADKRNDVILSEGPPKVENHNQSQKIPEINNVNSKNNEVENIRQKEANKRDVSLSERTENVQDHSRSLQSVDLYNKWTEISRLGIVEKRNNIILSERSPNNQQRQKVEEIHNFKSLNNEVKNIRQKDANKRDVSLSERTDNFQDSNSSESHKPATLYNKVKEISRREEVNERNNVILNEGPPNVQNHAQSQKIQEIHNAITNNNDVDNSIREEAIQSDELRIYKRVDSRNQHIHESNLFNKEDEISNLQAANEKNDVILNVERVIKSSIVVQDDCQSQETQDTNPNDLEIEHIREVDANGNGDAISSADNGIDNRDLQDDGQNQTIQEMQNNNSSSREVEISRLLEFNEKKAKMSKTQFFIRSGNYFHDTQESQEIQHTSDNQEVEILRLEKENERNEVRGDGLLGDRVQNLIQGQYIQRNQPSKEVPNMTSNDEEIGPLGANVLLKSPRVSDAYEVLTHTLLDKKKHSINAESPLFVPEESDEDTVECLEDKNLTFQEHKSVDINKSITKVPKPSNKEDKGDQIHKTNKLKVPSPTRKRNLIEEDVNLDLVSILPEARNKSREKKQGEIKENGNERRVAAKQQRLENAQPNKKVPISEGISTDSTRTNTKEKCIKEDQEIQNESKKREFGMTRNNFHNASNVGMTNIMPSGTSSNEKVEIKSRNKKGEIEHGSKSTILQREPTQRSTKNNRNENDRSTNSNSLKLPREDIRRNVTSQLDPLRGINLQGPSKNQIKAIVKKPAKEINALPKPNINTDIITNKPGLFDSRYNMSIFNDLNGLKNQNINMTDLNTFTIPKHSLSLPEQINKQLETRNIQSVIAREDNLNDGNSTTSTLDLSSIPVNNKIHVRQVVKKRLPISKNANHTQSVYLAKNMCRISPLDSDSDSDKLPVYSASKFINKSAVSSPFIRNDIQKILETASIQPAQFSHQSSILKNGDKIGTKNGDKNDIINHIPNDDSGHEANSSTNMTPENTNIGEKSIIKKRVRFLDPNEGNKKRRIEVRKKIYDKQNEILAKIGKPALPVPDDLAHLYPQKSTNLSNVQTTDPKGPNAKETIRDFKDKGQEEIHLDNSKSRLSSFNNALNGKGENKLIGSPNISQDERQIQKRENQNYSSDKKVSSLWYHKDMCNFKNGANYSHQITKNLSGNLLSGQRNSNALDSNENSHSIDTFQYRSPSLRYVRGEWSGRSRPSTTGNRFPTENDPYMSSNKSSHPLFDNKRSSRPSVAPRKKVLPSISKPAITQPNKSGPPQLERVIVQMEPYSEKQNTMLQPSQLSLSHTNKPPNTNLHVNSTNTANNPKVALNISDMLLEKPSPEIRTNPLRPRPAEYKSSETSRHDGNNKRHILPVIIQANSTNSKSSDPAGAVLLSFDEKSSSDEDTPLVRRKRRKTPGMDN